jgi:hypothetical protein
MPLGVMKLAIICVSLALASCRTWRGHVVELGLRTTDLTCPRTVMIGEPGHSGMPHIPMDQSAIVKLQRKIQHRLPEVKIVSDPASADLIISIVTSPHQVWTHRDNGADTDWVALIERGGASHSRESPGMAPFMELSGSVDWGSDVLGAFVKQLRLLFFSQDCMTPN